MKCFVKFSLEVYEKGTIFGGRYTKGVPIKNGL